MSISRIRSLVLLTTLPVFALRCVIDDGDDLDGGNAGETSEVAGGAPPSGGNSASGGTAGAAEENPSFGGVAHGGGAQNAGAGGAGLMAAGASGIDVGQAGLGGASNAAASTLVELPNADFRSGNAPETNNADDLPAINGLMSSSATTNGGTTTVRIELDGTPETPTFIVVIDGDSGYFIATATDTNGDGIYEIEIRIGADVDLSTLTVRIAPIDADGNVGAYQSVEYEFVKSGVGEVKVTLSFDQDADLDLHVVEPNGFEVFFDTPRSSTGGELDLDSNANCIIDGKNTENVFWPTDGAPDGTYTVSVEYFASCDVTEPVKYTVTVYNGPSIETFRGTFEPSAVDEQRLITTFVH